MRLAFLIHQCNSLCGFFYIFLIRMFRKKHRNYYIITPLIAVIFVDVELISEQV